MLLCQLLAKVSVLELGPGRLGYLGKLGLQILEAQHLTSVCKARRQLIEAYSSTDLLQYVALACNLIFTLIPSGKLS